MLRNAVAFVYPAYASLNCIKTTKSEEHIMWMTYWILFASTAIVECSTLGRVIPFFSVIRCVFLVMCYLPSVNVATGVQCDA